MSKMSGLRTVVLLSFASVIGLTLLVLGCALPAFGSWWPLFVLGFYIVSPLPLFFARNCYGADPSNGPNPCIELAYFLTTGIVLSAFGLPFVLAHAGAISYLSLFFVFLANGVLFAAIWGLFKFMYNTEHEGNLY
ncbi:hypothetical protein M3Y97_00575800 [Aphelenchoides bicaudatus]|nr:hypothetical protein M3Y97_00575800 [Aphelenchoides bicaudatus]